MQDLSRRRFVLGTGATIAASTLAGCGSDGGNGGGGGGGGGGGNGGNGSDGGSGGGDVPQEIDDYLSDANEYDGSLADHTGEDEVTVDVGGGNGLAFVPAAIRIDSGTTVTWEWTGEGGTHNVVHEDGEFESELYGEAGETFEHTFEEAGNYKYYCNPHRSSGMLGGVVVEE